MLKNFILFGFAFFLGISSSSVVAQCGPIIPAQGTCSGGNGAAYNGVNINSGETYWYSGVGTFPSGSNINNGGTLRICGNLTLQQITLNGGTIIVTSGATLVINGSGTLNLNNNVTIVNYGQLYINRDVVLQNDNNAIINASSSAVIHMEQYKLKIAGSGPNSNNILVNNGSILVNTLEITANSNGVCMGNQASIRTESFINTKTNAVSLQPGAVAVLQITGTAQSSAPITASSQLRICKGPNSTFSGNINTGAATIYQNCTSTAAALPIVLRSFQAKTAGSIVSLTWETEQEIDADYFIVEHSADGVQFEDRSPRIAAAGNSAQIKRYDWEDTNPSAGTNYYRLKQIDTDGSIHYYGIRSASVAQHAAATIFPNPVDQWLQINLANAETASNITLFDLTGQQVFSSRSPEGQQQLELDFSTLAPGTYTLSIANEKTVQTMKLVVK